MAMLLFYGNFWGHFPQGLANGRTVAREFPG